MELLEKIERIYAVSRDDSGFRYLQGLAANLAKVLNIQYVLIGRPLAEEPTTVMTDVVFAGKALAENFSYVLAGTPCNVVIEERRVCTHASGVIEKFPQDQLLQEMSIESYSGAPIMTPEHEILGILILLDTRPFGNPEEIAAINEFFAARVCAEYGRIQAEEELAGINQKLERLLTQKIEEMGVMSRKLMEQEKLVSLGGLVKNLAHEINNPMNLVRGGSGIIKNEMRELEGTFDAVGDARFEVVSGVVAECLDMIDTGVARVASLLDKIRCSVQQSDAALVPVDLVDAVRKSADRACAAWAARSAVPTNAHLYTKGELGRYQMTSDIDSIFSHMFENSLYFMEQRYRDDDSYQPELTIVIEERSSNLCVAIEDNGLGISEDNLGRIFEPLFTTKEGMAGSGVGLMMVRSIVKKNSGSISVHSKESESTRFDITFPLSTVGLAP